MGVGNRPCPGAFGPYRVLEGLMADAAVKEWIRLLGSSKDDLAYSISTAADGSIYITGQTYGSFDGQTNSSNGYAL